MSDIVVYAFMPAWGLPSSGPFALKLIGWMNWQGIGHEVRVENRSSKGPMGKSPWIETGGRRIADSDRIIRHLSVTRGLPDPTAPQDAVSARALAVKTAAEERLHQILEWELFCHPAGRAGMLDLIRTDLPGPVARIVLHMMHRHFDRQLKARGIGRMPPDEIRAEGLRQIEGLGHMLAEAPFLSGDRPALADFAVWGQVAPLLAWPMETPLAQEIKARPAIADWAARVAAQGQDGRTGLRGAT